MSVDLKGKRNARKAYADIHKTHGVIQAAADSIWHWLNGVASGAEHFFAHNVLDALKTVWAAIHTLVDAYRELVHKYFSIYYWVQIHVLKFLYHLIMHKYDVAIAQLHAQVRRLIRLIFVTTQQVLATAMHAIRRERSERIRDVRRAEAQAKLEVKALHHLIEREAASAYQVDNQTRVSLIVRLLEFAVTRNPELRAVVGDLIKGVLDLISVDDPLARLVLGFAINDVIDKLGIDRLVGNLIHDLLAPLLGEPKPRDLHAVIMDMGKRLVAAESFEATFTEDGGAEVEQAGRLWRDITKPAAALGIVAFTTLGVTNPIGWAEVMNNTFGRLGNDVIDGTANLIKGA